jgi:hypothetical protein
LASTVIEGPGYSITQTDEAEVSIPYVPQDRSDGNRNYGFRDLRDHPELVSEIPEARNSPGMQAILRALNSSDSSLMSLGCERTVHRLPEATGDDPSFVVVSYIGVAYRNLAQSAEPDNLIEVAKELLPGILGAGGHLLRFNFTVEPLRSFFGDDGRFALMIKPFGYGDSPDVAEAAWNYAAQKLADALARLPAMMRPTKNR